MSCFYYKVCNLYGACMKMKLPVKDFNWMTDEQLEEISIEEFPVDGDHGMILQVIFFMRNYCNNTYVYINYQSITVLCFILL